MIKSSFDLFKSFAGELDTRTLRKKFLLSLLKLQNVHRGSIWIKKNNSYHCIEAVGKESEAIIGIDINADQPSIVGWVIENGKRTVADTKSDIRHFKELEDNLAVKSSLILCFPLFLEDNTASSKDKTIPSRNETPSSKDKAISSKDKKASLLQKDKKVYGAVQIIDTTSEKSCVNLDENYLNYLQNLVDIGSVALSNAILYSRQVKETESLKVTLQQLQRDSTIIGHSKAFEQCINLARNYANSDLHVLITGESGTGKELIANEIHRSGPRSKKPFLVQNCSAIPETLLESELFGYKKGAFSGAVRDKKGLFEAAESGTVFLDEIGDMSLKIQAAILRVLQNNEIKPVGANRIIHVDVRIISATNRNIKNMIGENRFRQDMFYRLSVLPLELPPLRERREDIPLLIKYFLKQESLKTGIKEKKMKPNAMHRLITWSWPGNIRELENLIKYLMVVTDSDYIDTDAIPDHFFESFSQNQQNVSSPISEEKNRSEGKNRIPPIRNKELMLDTQSSEPSAYQHRIELDRVLNNALDSAEMNSRRNRINFGNLSWKEVEEHYIRSLLLKNNWNVTWAAKDAGVNRSTFASRMRRLKIRRSNPGQYE